MKRPYGLAVTVAGFEGRDPRFKSPPGVGKIIFSFFNLF
jgi:hypothetical protein